MKRILWFLLVAALCLPVSCQDELTDSNGNQIGLAWGGSVNSYPESATPETDDMVIMVDEPGGSWSIKRAKIGNLFVRVASASFTEPHNLATSDIALLPIESDWAPSGITLLSCGIKTDNSSTYSVDFEEWTAPDDSSPSAIETVATSSSYEAEDDGTLTDSSIAVGSIVYVDLPTTSGTTLLTVWFTYRIN